jgi:hypothetical protein
METRTFHGKILPEDLARGIIAYFNRGNYRVQKIGQGDAIAVQIATAQMAQSGGQTALSISFQAVEDGVSVQIGQQAWLGVAASLGWTALSAIHNPLSLLNRLDDLAQDIESLQLTEEAWKIIHATADALGAGHELSERLRRLECPYCGVSNPAGKPYCLACGAPLGEMQPAACHFCGYVLKHEEEVCPNCGRSQ